MQILVVVLALVASAAAFEGNEFFGYDEAEQVSDSNCCAPNQWEGRVATTIIKKKFFRPHIILSESKVGFDYTNKRVGANSSVICKRTRKVYHARSVADFKAKKAYLIYGHNKCKVFKLKNPMQRPCIPSSFKNLTSFHLGAGSDSLKLRAYGARMKTVEALIVATQRSCIPVRGAFRIRHGHKTKAMGKHAYFNIAAGVKDKDLFNVPASCHNAEVEEDDDTKNDQRGFWDKYSPRRWWKRQQRRSLVEWDLEEHDGHYNGAIHNLVYNTIEHLYKNKPRKSWKQYTPWGRKGRHNGNRRNQ